MPQGSDPRRWPDQQSPDPGSPTQPGWWSSMWHERLPREVGEPAPARALGTLLQGWSQRAVMAMVPLLVVAAVVFGSFGFTLVSEIMAAAILLILAGAALHPIWRRSRDRAGSWWR